MRSASSAGFQLLLSDYARLVTYSPPFSPRARNRDQQTGARRGSMALLSTPVMSAWVALLALLAFAYWSVHRMVNQSFERSGLKLAGDADKPGPAVIQKKE
eukprot:jgi/Tetstr1/455080/TSEL_041933.t1